MRVILVVRLVAICAATLVPCTVATSEPESALGQPLDTGVSYVYGEDPVAFDRVRDTGARLVHTWLRWSAIAPMAEPANWDPTDPSDPHYDWDFADHWVENATRMGLTPLLQVFRVPSWAQLCDNRGAAGVGTCRPDPTKLAEFAQAAARRYSGRFAGLPRVRYWQALNEPNLSLFFNPQFANGRVVSAALYRKLINAFYAAVKSASRSNLVVSAGLGPLAIPRFTVGPMRFARLLLCMAGRRRPHPTAANCEGGVRFDIFDIHPYTSGAPHRRGRIDDVQLGDLEKLKRLLRAAEDAGRIKGRFPRTPIWITEFSWDSKPPDPGGVKMSILARWTAEALYRTWTASISRFFWYSLRDDAPTSRPFSQTYESGLYFRGPTVAEDRPKPIMYAFRFPFVAYSRADGFFFWGRTPNSKGGRVVIQVRKGGGWRNAVVARADKFGIFKGVAKGGYGRRKRGFARARYRGESAVPFSLKPVKGFYQPPFGRPVG